MEIRTINEEWRDFEGKVIHPRAPEMQRIDMKRAFYAGVLTMFKINEEIGKPEVSEEQGVKILEKLYSELLSFVLKDVKSA